MEYYLFHFRRVRTAVPSTRSLRRRGPRTRRKKARFVENERLGFDSREMYNDLATEPGSEPDIGEYEFTVWVFSEGFISRVLVGGEGSILTTDSIDMRDFETVAVALRVLLAESAHR